MKTELEQFEAILPTIKNINMIFDVGCDRLELSTPILRNAFPSAIIHCFEPDPRCMRKLIETGKHHELGVIFHPVGLSNVAGHRRLWLSVANSSLILPDVGTLSSSIKYPKTLGKETHPVTFSGDSCMPYFDTLDRFCSVRDITSIDLLHMEHNTGGCYEGEVGLDGLMKLLPGWETVYCGPYDVMVKNPIQSSNGS